MRKHVATTTANTSNQSTEKALAILEILSTNHTPMRLSEISGILHANQSTTRRYLSSLINCGYVCQDSKTSLYRMSFKICSLANSLIQTLDIREISHPVILQLSEIFQESICVAVEKNHSVIFADVASGPTNSLMSVHHVGCNSPMHCTASGKLLMLSYSDAEIDFYIEKNGLPYKTENTLTTKAALLDELSWIREHGYAWDRQECELGMQCFAFPIRNYSDNIVASISVTGPTIRVNQNLFDQKSHYLEKAAADISNALGYTN